MWRLANLELIPRNTPDVCVSSKELSELDKGLSRDEYTNSSRLPERYVRFAFKAYSNSSISIGRLADLLETSVSELSDELEKLALLDSDVVITLHQAE